MDHWSESLDVVEALRSRLHDAGDRETRDTGALMAQVAHAKSSSFIALLDPDGYVLDINPAALISGGLDRAEVIGMPFWNAAWWREAGIETTLLLRSSVVAAGRGQLARFDIDMVSTDTNSVPGTLDLMLRPLRGRDGIIAFVIAEGRSITDRKLVEQRLARNNAELSALTERLARVHDYRERLLGELSHDLRAPLQVVVTRADQVLRTGPDDELRRQISGIRLAALDALEQVSDMLEQVKSDHGEARLTIVNADLAQAVRTVAEQFEPLALDRDLELRINVPDRAQAHFDIERLSRIVSNLFANAIRHTPPAGVVRCELRIGESSATLEIADSGPGVPVEHRQKVFGRYRSGLSGDGRSGGAGLGLAIVREFVELHGGDISLGEAPEGGALFVVTMPLSPPQGAGEPASLSQHVAAAQRTQYVRAHLEAELADERGAAGFATVVIVERVPGRAESIAAGVDEGTVTCVVEDAEEAMRVTLELRPDAIVVGTVVGDEPATRLLRRLAADERLADVRRVALAGEREEDPSPEALLAAGAHLVLPASAAEASSGKLWSAALGHSA